MNIIKRLFSGKASRASKIIVNNPFQIHSPNRNYKALSDEGYRKNVVAKRCIDYIASSVADIQINIFEKRRDLIVESHPLLDLLDNPNPTQCYEEYMKSLVSYFMLHGNLFSEAVSGTTRLKNPQELWVQRPDRMKVVPGVSGVPSAFVMEANGKRYKWEVDFITGNSPILHMKTFNPLDDWYGMSFLESAAFSVDQFNQAMIWNVSLLKNSARPSGAFVLEKTSDPNFQGLTDNQRAQIRQEINDIYTGSGNSGRPMLLEGGLGFQEMGLSPKDMDWTESKNSSTRDICMGFGVPPQLVGVTGDSTYANYEQARMAFYDNTAIPIARLITKGLTRWLMPMYEKSEKLELRIDVDSIEALAPRRKAKWDMVSNSNFLTTNEKRIETGYGRYEASDEPADQIFVNASLIPLDFAGSLSEEELLEDTEDIEDIEEEQEEEEGKSIEIKNFNITNRAKRRQFWLQQTRKLKRNEVKMRNKVATVLTKEGKQLAEDIDGADPMVWQLIADQNIEEFKLQMEKAISSSTEETMRDFNSQLKRSAKSCFNYIETKNQEDRFEAFLKNYIKVHTAESVTKITNTTRKRLKKLFKDLQKQNEDLSIVDISKEVSKAYSAFTPSRSLAIARTETHNASMSSQLKTAKDFQLPGMKKDWISSRNERSRDGSNGPNHIEMDGKKVNIDEQFEVKNISGVDLMDSPGDPSAPANQIINCRCVLAFSTGE